MFDNKKNNSDCNFSEEIVSYLYDEFSGSDKSEFQTHLLNCSDCADEIASFVSVRSSIQNWKEIDFNNLQIPHIEIEFGQSRNQLQTIKTIEQNLSWLDKFKNFLSPLVVKTTTGFAAIAIILGLGWFVFSFFQNESFETADKSNAGKTFDKNKEIDKQVTDSEKPEIVKEPEADLSKENAVEQDEVAAENSGNRITTKKQTANRNNSAAKVSGRKNIRQKNNPVLTAENKPKNIRKSKENSIKPEQQNPVITEQAPSLSEFAIEDTSDNEIRLSDIFEEIGSDN